VYHHYYYFFLVLIVILIFAVVVVVIVSFVVVVVPCLLCCFGHVIEIDHTVHNHPTKCCRYLIYYQSNHCFWNDDNHVHRYWQKRGTTGLDSMENDNRHDHPNYYTESRGSIEIVRSNEHD